MLRRVVGTTSMFSVLGILNCGIMSGHTFSTTNIPPEESGSYHCSNPDYCELGAQCDGSHSYSKDVLRYSYGISSYPSDDDDEPSVEGKPQFEKQIEDKVVDSPTKSPLNSKFSYGDESATNAYASTNDAIVGDNNVADRDINGADSFVGDNNNSSYGSDSCESHS